MISVGNNSILRRLCSCSVILRRFLLSTNRVFSLQYTHLIDTHLVYFVILTYFKFSGFFSFLCFFFSFLLNYWIKFHLAGSLDTCVFKLRVTLPRSFKTRIGSPSPVLVCHDLPSHLRSDLGTFHMLSKTRRLYHLGLTKF